MDLADAVEEWHEVENEAVVELLIEEMMEVSEQLFVEILGKQHWDWYLSLANYWIDMQNSNFAFVAVDSKFGCFQEYVEDCIEDKNHHNKVDDAVVDNIDVVE